MTRFCPLLRALWQEFSQSHGSAFLLALIRMGLVANAWARWSNEHVLYRDLNPESLLLSVLFFVSSVLLFAGFFTPVSRWLFAGVCCFFVYGVGHHQGHEPYTHHHTTLLALSSVLLALSPCGRALSVDRLLALRRSRRQGREPPTDIVPLWSQRLLALQVSSVYLFGAYDKCNWGFLSGARMSHYLMRYYTGPTSLEEMLPGSDLIMGAAAIATVALEFLLAFGLFIPSVRRWLLLPGLLLHGAFYFSLSVFTYTTTMWVLYLAFLDPDEAKKGFAELLLGPRELALNSVEVDSSVHALVTQNENEAPEIQEPRSLTALGADA